MECAGICSILFFLLFLVMFEITQNIETKDENWLMIVVLLRYRSLYLFFLFVPQPNANCCLFWVNTDLVNNNEINIFCGFICSVYSAETESHDEKNDKDIVLLQQIGHYESTMSPPVPITIISSSLAFDNTEFSSSQLMTCVANDDITTSALKMKATKPKRRTNRSYTAPLRTTNLGHITRSGRHRR